MKCLELVVNGFDNSASEEELVYRSHHLGFHVGTGFGDQLNGVVFQELIGQGLGQVYHKDIAAELGVHPRTVSRALQRERERCGSKLDPYKATVDRLLHHATTLNVKGESYRLKEKRRAGLLGRPKPADEAEEAHVEVEEVMPVTT